MLVEMILPIHITNGSPQHNDNEHGEDGDNDDLSARHFLLHIQSKSGQLGTKLGAIAANSNLVKFNI